MDLNRVFFIGNLTHDPDPPRTLPSGASVINFSIAVNSRRGQNEETMFLRISAFGRTSEIVSQYCQKGSQVLVEGRLRINEYETRDGQKRRDPEVNADRISLGARPRGGDSQGSDYGGGSSNYAPPPPQNAPSYDDRSYEREDEPQQNDEQPQESGEAKDDLPF